MLLIKLGGSVISDKTEYRRFREDVVWRIAKVLPKEDMILVHGAGSFGHILAHKYRITEGYGADKRLGFAKIQRDMMELNLRILDILVDHEIPVVSMPPHSFVEIGRELELKLFDSLITHKFVPLTYGDAVFDVDKGINIYSGDILMQVLAERYRPEKTIFLTNVDGIYTKPPDEAGAELIPVLRREKDPHTAVTVKDVTGGMELKIDVMREIAKYSKVYIINGFYPERLKNVINDEDFVGTVVL